MVDALAKPSTLAKPFWPDRSPHFLTIRHAVRAMAQQAGQGLGDGVVIGLSGGADSLALTAGACAEAFGPKGALADRNIHAVVVDHQLQQGSAEVAEHAADLARGMGATAEVVAVDINNEAGRGPEYEARLARHRVLREIAQARSAALLLAHTLDDQAETVLLRLARGGGPQALSAIRADLTWSDGTRILRPLLGVRRTDTELCCEELGLKVWHDPHNHDDRYARVRVRQSILPLLERELGPGVAENLAKTASIAAADNDCLDARAESALETLLGEQAASEGGGLPVRGVAELDDAISVRLLARWLRRAGAEPSSKQIDMVLALVHRYHGQGEVPVTRGRGAAAETKSAGARLVVERKDGTLQLGTAERNSDA